ncbi:tetratricopeptide repeat protein, partial [Candidatus Poribacteria bacterium]|nr:tetratricopeptide repeat protein [Candidatus Poribacteria bacterium]
MLKLNPNYAAAYYKLGHLYFRARKLQQAKTAYLRTVELDPKQGAAHAGLGAIY